MSDEPCEASMTGHPSPVWRNVLPTQMYPSGIKFRFDVFMPASDDLKHSCVDSHKIELQDFVARCFPLLPVPASSVGGFASPLSHCIKDLFAAIVVAAMTLHAVQMIVSLPSAQQG